MSRLGDILVAHGAISRDELERSLPRLQGRIGAALRAHTLIRSRSLARAIAEQRQLPYVVLSEAPCATGLFIPRDLDQYLHYQYLPYRILPDRLQVVTPDPSSVLRETLEQHYRCAVELLVISSRDFTSAISAQAADTLMRRAALALRRSYKALVADRVLVRSQQWGFLILASLLCLAVILVPRESAYAAIFIINLFYMVTLAFKLQLLVQGKKERRQQETGAYLDGLTHTVADGQWPVYTILVPLYREGFPVLSRLIGHLHALDYPREKLDIKLICEEDDIDTLAALKRCKPPETMEIISVTPSYPRTKPKACNVALPHIRGKYLVIFDAEDAPEPRQLKRAVVMFAHQPAQVACLQVPLNYYNRTENLLTRLFSLEYSALFRLTLPAMQRLQLPIPLGGTSNHLRVEALRNVGGWDAFNVTEDADLGIRLAYFGYRTRMLPSLTLEEAPISYSAWLGQRSRWIKGYIQTWLVYMRDPAELKRRLGVRGYYGFQFFIGAPALTFLIAPFFWMVFFADRVGVLPMGLPLMLVTFCILSFVGGIAVQLLYALSVVRIERWQGMRWALAAYPFYWLLHSIASILAIWQLARAPHVWSKTAHGVSRMFR